MEDSTLTPTPTLSTNPKPNPTPIPHQVLEIMEDYWRKLPAYQGVALDDLELRRVRPLGPFGLG